MTRRSCTYDCHDEGDNTDECRANRRTKSHGVADSDISHFELRSDAWNLASDPGSERLSFSSKSCPWPAARYIQSGMLLLRLFSDRKLEAIAHYKCHWPRCCGQFVSFNVVPQ